MAVVFNDSVTEAIRARFLAAGKDAAQAILDAAKANAPVKSGRLRDSGHLEPGPDGGFRVVFDTPYAAVLENGGRTRNGGTIQPRHYLQRAVAETGPRVEQILRQAIEE